jgi:hypothetical protein
MGEAKDEMDEALGDLGAFLAECRKAADDGDISKAERMLASLEEMRVELDKACPRKRDPFDVEAPCPSR